MKNLTHIFRADELGALHEFLGTQDQLAIIGREIPAGSDDFFQKLMRLQLSVAGNVDKQNAVQDIKYILEDEIPDTLLSDPFYEHWICDMAEVCNSFCDTQGTDAVGFWLGSERGCRRYHTDNVDLRALVTYAGQGTEYLPDEAANRAAFANGESNDRIVKDPKKRQFMNAWDVAVFRGGPKGILHRTPDDALNGPSILMRLDHPGFWNRIMRQQHAPS